MDRRGFVIGAACLPLAARATVPEVRFRDLYGRGGAFSEFTEANRDREVSVVGYMAPPLKAEARFFVLTQLPMSYCPFCESAAEWPEDIVLVYTREVISVVPYTFAIRVSGRLDLGPWTDPETGFWSKIRLMGADYVRA